MSRANYLKGPHISEEQIRALPGGRSAVWVSKEGDP
jgi:hypothetical protein